MKIIACHIENFGKLSDTDFIFQNGLNIINEKNGTGKSTLAAFIKVMFFGFANENKRNDLEKERKRYMPWQGGIYGGQLTFETGGRTYRIERTFGAKEKEDTYTLYDDATGLESTDFSEKIGEELFQLDQASFVRTVFIAQNDCETASTDRINAKLGNLAEHTDDMNQYETVQKTLSDRLNAMSPTRKTGSIYKKKQEISDLKESIRKGKEIDRTIGELNKKREAEKQRKEALEDKKRDLQKTISRLAGYKEIQGKKIQYDELCRQYQERKQQFEEAGRYFKGVIPEDAELVNCLAEASRLSEYRKSLELLQLPEEEASEGIRLEQVFRDGVPSESVMAEMREEIGALSNLKLEMADGNLSTEEKERLEAYQNQFQGKKPEETEIQDMLSVWSQRTEKKNLLGTKRASLSVMQSVAEQKQPVQPERQKHKWKFHSLFLLAGIILCAAGIAGFIVNAALGILGAAVGLGCVVFGIAAGKSKREADSTEADSKEAVQQNEKLLELQEEIRQDETFIEEAGRKMQAFFTAYQLPYEEQNVQGTLFRLQNQVHEYKMLREKQESYKAKKLEEKYREKEQGIRSYLSIYQSEEQIRQGSCQDAFQLLEQQIEAYRRYRTNRRQYQAAKTEYDDLLVKINGYILSLSMTPQEDLQEQLQELRYHLQQYRSSQKELAQAESRKKEFEERNDMNIICSADEPEQTDSLEELNEELNQITEEISRIAEHIVDYSVQLDQAGAAREIVSEEEESLNIALDERADMEHRYQIYTRTQEYLELARTNFTAKYMEPIMKGFRKYYRLLTGEDTELYQMNANIELSVKEYGKQRDIRFLSSGYQNLIGICMRMALVDAMYQEEKPFVILDDPFVNLDNEKVQGGLQFLSRAAEDYQMIYFTCHESRT